MNVTVFYVGDELIPAAVLLLPVLGIERYLVRAVLLGPSKIGFSISNNLPLRGTVVPLMSSGLSAPLPGRIKKLWIESISIAAVAVAACF